MTSTLSSFSLLSGSPPHYDYVIGDESTAKLIIVQGWIIPRDLLFGGCIITLVNCMSLLKTG